MLHVGVLSASEGRRWVALSADAAGVKGLNVDPAQAQAIRELLTAAPKASVLEAGGVEAVRGAGDRLLRGADVIAWVRGDGIQQSVDRAVQQRLEQAQGLAPDALAEAREAAMRAKALLSAVDIAVMSWDIDALGLIGRGLIRLDQSSPHAAPFRGGARSSVGMDGGRLGLLPAQAPYFAVGVDLDGLGGVEALEALEAALSGPMESGMAMFKPWIAGAREVQLAIYPSKLGLAVGGVLNDAALVVRTDQPEGLRDAVRGRLEALQGEQNGVRRTLKWQSDRPVKDAGTADAFELEQVVLPGRDGGGPGLGMELISTIVLGSRGVHGFMMPSADRALLVTTFSQRPDVWRRASAASRLEGSTLGATPGIGAMRRLAIDDPDVEVVIGVTQLVKLAQQVARMVPGGEEAIPALDAGTEPIYSAMEVDDFRVEAAWIIPSAVVGLLVDQAKRTLVGR